MGLGINAANNPDFNNYELAKLTNIELVKQTDDKQTINNYKTEFGRWIVGNGLRELIETFGVFLDEIHLACLLASTISHDFSEKKIKSDSLKFQKFGLKNKLEKLKEACKVIVKDPDYLLSINQARHCLTHRRGIVGHKDCLNGNELVIKWKALHVIVETPSGEQIFLDPMPEEGIFLPEGGQPKVSYAERSKTFKVNAQIDFTPGELAEFCAYILVKTDEAISSTLDYLKILGISIKKQE